ncbi:MAG: hypothetical protein JW874_06785 [Spirochaetales bacterium]|nr:hypothetical protein [Spirochaetales bacterium]
MKKLLNTGAWIICTTILFFACDFETNPDPAGIVGPYLFMTDTMNGNVYLYDINEKAVMETALFSTGAGGTGEIYFYGDNGYIAIGTAYSGEVNPGLFYFDPEAAVPAIERIGDAISAQAVAFYSDSKAYVVDANYGVSSGVYTFNPADPGAGLTGPIDGTVYDGTNGVYLQDIVIGMDGNVYVSDNGNGMVIQLNPEDDTVLDTIATTSFMTSGLVAANIGGTDVIFAAGYGSIDRIDCDTGVVTPICNTGAVYLAYDPFHSIIYAAGWYNSYSIDISGTGPYSAVEILDDGASFGGGDVEIFGGSVYISNNTFAPGAYNSKLYIIEAATGTFAENSPVAVMDQANDGICGLAVYVY